jgi:hypothetical protein
MRSFSTSRPSQVLGDDRELGVGQIAVHPQGALESLLVVVGDHDQVRLAILCRSSVVNEGG